MCRLARQHPVRWRDGLVHDGFDLRWNSLPVELCQRNRPLGHDWSSVHLFRFESVVVSAGLKDVSTLSDTIHSTTAIADVAACNFHGINRVVGSCQAVSE